MNERYTKEVTKNLLSIYREYFVERLNKQYPNLEIKKYKRYYNNQIDEFDKGLKNMFDEINIIISSKIENKGKFEIGNIGTKNDSPYCLNKEFESIFLDYIGDCSSNVLPKDSKICVNGNKDTTTLKIIFSNGKEISKKIDNKVFEIEK